LSSSPLLQGVEKIDKNSAGQNWTVQFFQTEHKRARSSSFN
jgi:hypothetical protein